jgi:hypothetical protein
MKPFQITATLLPIVVMHRPCELERNFVGCDIAHSGTEEADHA